MITEDLRTFADDIGTRLRDLPWWEDAVFVAGKYPTGDRNVRTAGMRLFLIGTGEDEPRVTVVSTRSRNGRTWLEVPALYELADPVKFSMASATAPRPRPGWYPNVTLVRYSRLDGPLWGKCGFAHDPRFDQPESAHHLDDLDWVSDLAAEYTGSPIV